MMPSSTLLAFEKPHSSAKPVSKPYLYIKPLYGPVAALFCSLCLIFLRHECVEWWRSLTYLEALCHS